ncbi:MULTISPECIES: hypothetical protein [Pseudomonas]|uniref:Uncharacterized protein n=1 Tax=Pseudomonas carnis TaxID=2487355 RepID=A0ABT5RCM0_9PSED|nr:MULTISPECIES: hypothetical protein [Pseudomonas]KWV69497.1 hypothetical protein PFLuk1_02959 [Pseudomonas fluorescens]MBJ2210604.1 hypothetical protein [Pseudomonas carnis]MDD1943727.1 hypothetical protein [Pseudomonas carnis]
MANSLMKSFFELAVASGSLEQNVPTEVIQAQRIDWGVMVDAYLIKAARVGQTYAALVYNDQSSLSSNGMTVATPPLVLVEVREGFMLMRSLSGQDHFVITSELSEPR